MEISAPNQVQKMKHFKLSMLKQAHLQAAARHDTNQSVQKSLLSPTMRKNKKPPSLKKNKTLPTRIPTGKTKMTELIDYYNGMSLDKKEGQLVTGGISYCRDSMYFSVSASNKLSCNLTVKCFEIGNKNIPPIRYRQYAKIRSQKNTNTNENHYTTISLDNNSNNELLRR